jgi:hypothetical protein
MVFQALNSPDDSAINPDCAAQTRNYQANLKLMAA